MKIAIIGGAGVRTPLLARGLAASDLPLDEIALFDLDRDRLAVIAALARSYAPMVSVHDDARACVSNADFVILSIRAGGIVARARDEAIAMVHGVLGQETVGPAGFAMAMRTVRPAVGYARLVAREAPRAWLINFTNPVGIVTQSMAATGARVIGICDTPAELFADVARALGLPAQQCFFDYLGLNHLGWLREVYFRGEPQLAGIWNRAEQLRSVYRTPLFEPAFLRNLMLLPTEYLFFYYWPRVALANTLSAGETRGQTIAKLNAQLFEDLVAAPDSRQGTYEAYLDARSAGYLRIESSGTRTEAQRPGSGARTALTGYDWIAFQVIHAIHADTNRMMVLNVPNRGSVAILEDEDIVEVPCVVGAKGARPLSVGTVPDGVRDLLLAVKEYERLAVCAAASRTDHDAIRALAANPLVASPDLATALMRALQPW